MIKISVIVYYGKNAIKLQLLQYIIQYKIMKLYVVSKHPYFGLPLYVANFEIRCLVCNVYAMNKCVNSFIVYTLHAEYLISELVTYKRR